MTRNAAHESCCTQCAQDSPDYLWFLRITLCKYCKAGVKCGGLCTDNRRNCSKSVILRGYAVIQTPYLLFLGDAPDQLSAKVAQGIKDWRPDNAVGQFRMDGCAADVGIKDMTLEEGLAAGA